MNSTARPRRARTRLLLPLLVLVVALAAACLSPDERQLLDLANGARAGAGTPALVESKELTTKAQAWSQHMVDTGTLAHSNLLEGLPAGCTAVAENVGYDWSIAELHDAWMASGGHRANIMNGTYNVVGIGVTQDVYGRYWGTEVFASC